jgi:hypothetical protein
MEHLIIEPMCSKYTEELLPRLKLQCSFVLAVSSAKRNKSCVLVRLHRVDTQNRTALLLDLCVDAALCLSRAILVLEALEAARPLSSVGEPLVVGHLRTATYAAMN